MKTKTSSILLVIICTLFASVAQVMYKTGTKTLAMNFHSIITNYYIIGGLLLYAVSALLLIIALQKGELSILYPIIALSYVWVSIMSIYFLEETMSMLKWIGVGAIIFGVSFIGIGSQQNDRSRKKARKKSTAAKLRKISRRKTK